MKKTFDAEGLFQSNVSFGTYLIESLFVVSLVAESPAIWVEVESVALIEDIDEVESVTVVEVSFDSVLLLEQAVASTIIDKKKKADFAMV